MPCDTSPQNFILFGSCGSRSPAYTLDSTLEEILAGRIQVETMSRQLCIAGPLGGHGITARNVTSDEVLIRLEYRVSGQITNLDKT